MKGSAVFAAVFLFWWACADTLAQQDVPPGHWAYEAVQTLIRQGVLRGYPDGTFRGRSPLTRYEFAVALREAWREVSRRVQDLVRDPREASPPAVSPPLPLADITPDLREKLRALPEDVGERLQRLEEQTRILRQLLEEFARDLETLGEDVRRLQYEMSGVESQIRSLEQRWKQRARVRGTLDLIGRGSHGIGGKSAIDQNGYLVQGALLRHAHVTHELTLQIDAELARRVRAEVELVVGNFPTYLQSASRFANVFQRTAGATDFLLWKAQVDVPVGLFGRDGSLSVGRIENRMTPLTLWRPDVDVYTLLARYDSGYYSMDGLKLELDTDLVSLMLYAAKHNTVRTNLLPEWMPLSAGNDPANLFQPGNPLRQRPNRIASGIVPVGQSAGVSAVVRLGRALSVGAQFATMEAVQDLATSLGTVDRVNVWGWQAEWTPSDHWNLIALYAQSDLLDGTATRLSRDNWAFLVRAQYQLSSGDLVWVGYREFGPYFAAPGYWGRIGYWHNPTDLRGVDVGARERVGRVLFELRGGLYRGTGKATPPAGFGTEDKVSYLALLTWYQVHARCSMALSFERVWWNLRDLQRFNPFAGLSFPGNPRENYVTLSASCNLSDSTQLRAVYQLIFYNAKGVASYSLLGSGKEQGGVAVLQLSTSF